MSCKEWNKVKIEEVCSIKRGASPRPIINYISETGIPWVKISDATSHDSRFIKKTGEFIIEEGKNKSRFIKSGTLILSNSATPGIPKIMGIDACVHDGWLIIDNFKNISKEFMYYLFINERERLLSLSNGSVFRNLKTDIVKNYEVMLPEKEEQNRIVNVLLSLDNKIELNNKMNKTLEEMAQALFKRWFVDFEFPNEEGKPYKSSGGEMVESELGVIPKGWNVNNLKDISTITMGVSPSSNSYNDDKVGLPLLNGAADFEGKLIKPSKYTSEPKKVCKCGDMIFGVRATIGNTVFADKEYALGRGVASVSPKNYIFREFIYFCLNSSMNKLINSASGSVFLNLKKADITDLKLCYSEVVINKFNKIAKELINKVIENDIESEILKQQRDSLLPKLMSGEIRVDNVETDI